MINEGTLNWYSHLHEGIASKHGSMQMTLSSNISHIHHSIHIWIFLSSWSDYAEFTLIFRNIYLYKFHRNCLTFQCFLYTNKPQHISIPKSKITSAYATTDLVTTLSTHGFVKKSRSLIILLTL